MLLIFGKKKKKNHKLGVQIKIPHYKFNQTSPNIKIIMYMEVLSGEKKPMKVYWTYR